MGGATKYTVTAKSVGTQEGPLVPINYDRSLSFTRSLDARQFGCVAVM